MWGITEANVQGVEKQVTISTGNVEIDPILREKVETELNQQFRHTDRQHPFISELFRLLTLRRSLNKLGDENHGS